MAIKKIELSKESLPPFDEKHFLIGRAVDKLLEDANINIFMSTEVAKQYCLITWLITNADAVESNLGITRFEKWPWTVEGNRYSLNFLWKDQNYKKWVNLTRRAWAKIETEREEIGWEKGQHNKRGRPRKNTYDECRRMQKAYDKKYRETQNSRAAWNEVAELYGKKNGDAVRKACENYRKNKLEKRT
ncbi:MAG: hypothetical protein ABIG61_08900 [Planctomycetota bacterium]